MQQKGLQTGGRPANRLGASKAAAECLVRGFAKSFRLPAVIVRPNNIYGPRQWPEKLIPKSIALFSAEKPFPVHGHGLNTRSFLFIEDAVAAFELILRRGQPGEAYNISQPDEISNIDVLQSVLSCLGRPLGGGRVDANDPRYFKYVQDIRKENINDLSIFPGTQKHIIDRRPLNIKGQIIKSIKNLVTLAKEISNPICGLYAFESSTADAFSQRRFGCLENCSIF